MKRAVTHKKANILPHIKKLVGAPAFVAVAAIIMYACFMYFGTLLTYSAVSALIDENGITYKTLPYYPDAVRIVIYCAEDICRLPAAALCAVLAVLYIKHTTEPQRPRVIASVAAYIGGIALPGLCLALQLVSGCVRTMSATAPVPTYEAIKFISVTICALSFDAVSLGIVYGCMKYLPSYVRIACGTLVYFVLTFGSSSVSTASLISAALFALLIISLRERFGLASVCSFRAAWAYAATRIWAMSTTEYTTGIFFETYKTKCFYLSGINGVITCAVIAACAIAILMRRSHKNEDRPDMSH